MFKEFSDNSRSEEFLNEFRQKMADQTASNIEERKNEIKRSRSVFIGTLSGLILAGMIGGFILAPRYNKNLAGYIPVIKGPEEEVKYTPEDKGGMEIADKDKSVYEVLDNSQSEEEVVETIMPAPEEPKLPEVVAIEENYAPTTIDDIIQSAEEDIANESAAAIAEISEQNPEKTSVSAETVESIAETNPSNREKMNEIKSVVDNTLNAEKNEKTELAQNEKAEPVQDAKISSAQSGDWQIQVMSAKDKDGIEKSWKNLQAKHSFFAGLPHEIEKADLGASGIYYRLKAGSFASKEDAEKVCNQYKAVKGSCLVKKK